MGEDMQMLHGWNMWEKEYQPGNFLFDSFRDNENIGNDQIKRQDVYMTYEKYPFFTCEMGVGVQNTYHRRLSIDPFRRVGYDDSQTWFRI